VSIQSSPTDKSKVQRQEVYLDTHREVDREVYRDFDRQIYQEVDQVSHEAAY
jgi:hypothetical protein